MFHVSNEAVVLETVKIVSGVCYCYIINFATFNCLLHGCFNIY